MSDGRDPGQRVRELVRQLDDPDAFNGAAVELWKALRRYLKWRVAQVCFGGQGLAGDSSSLALDAFNDFLTMKRRGAVKVEDRTGILNLLSRIVRNKTIDRLRRETAAKRRPQDGNDSTSNLREDSAATAPGSDELLSFSDLEGRGVADARIVRHPSRMSANVRVSRPVIATQSDEAGEPTGVATWLTEVDPWLREVLLDAIDRLPPDLRQVFDLVIVQGSTYDDAAEQLDYSPRLVESKIVSIRKLLKSLKSDSTLEVAGKGQRKFRSP